MKLITVILILHLGMRIAAAQRPLDEDWRVHGGPTRDTLHNAFFISDRTGWAISHQTGLVLQTVDRGKTWKIQASLGHGYLESIFFVDRSNGWIVGDAGRFFSTTDGGASWTKNAPFRATVALSAVHFFDKHRGVVFGFDLENRQAVVFETSDAGKNWTDRSKELPAGVSLSDAIFRFSKGSILIGGSGYLRLDGPKARFQVSRERSTATVRGLFFVNDRDGWSVGHSGFVARTNDGGDTWKSGTSFTSSILRSICFLNDNVGWAVGNRDQNGTSMWKTKDAGASWKEVEKRLPNLHRIVSTKTKIWLFGADGLIMSRSR